MNGVQRYFRVENADVRLDRFLSDQCPDLSRSQIQQLMHLGLATLNGEIVKPSQKVQLGDFVRAFIPPPKELELTPEKIPISIVYEDTDLLVVDKPPGLTVHPAPGHPKGTLVNALLAIRPNLKEVGDASRPGIVHRLDKDTSGLIMVAKSQRAYLHLSSQLKQRQVEKRYLALVWSHPLNQSGIVKEPIARNPLHRKRMAVIEGGRDSTTHYTVSERVGIFALLEVTPHTGRTHQIRVHMAHIGHPLVGDTTYSRRPQLLPRHFLHAYKLAFTSPSTQEWIELTSPLPADLYEALEGFRENATK